jgi:hypothetical protein
MPRRARNEINKQGQHAGYARPSPKQPWRLVCHGPSWRACWLRLVEMVGNDGEQDLVVLEAGKSPSTLPGTVESIAT